VDALLAQRAADTIEKIPAIYDRLAEGDSEAISQALTSCRRLLVSFADAVYPPREADVLVGEQPTPVGAQHHKNRIFVYITERTTSASRRHRLRQTLTNLHDRTSAGVHDDVTTAEARSLFLETYLLLGEVLELGPVPAPPTPTAPPSDNTDTTSGGEPTSAAGISTAEPVPITQSASDRVDPA
jgi:hypothetical protein